jgi:hypothetical protein
MNSPSEQNYIQQVSIDCLIFGYDDKQLKVLVPKLDFKWGFPGASKWFCVSVGGYRLGCRENP